MLHNQKQSARSLNNFVKLNYVWMPDNFQNVYFAGDSFYIVYVLDLVLLQNLNCHLLLGV